MAPEDRFTKDRRLRPRDERRCRAQDVILDGKGKPAPKLPAAVRLSPTGRAWGRALWGRRSLALRDVDLPSLFRKDGLGSRDQTPGGMLRVPFRS